MRLATLLITVGIFLTLLIVMWVNDRWVKPRKMHEAVARTLARMESGAFVAPPYESDFAVSFDGVGVSIARVRPAHETLYSMGWSDIVRVVAFKRDLLAVDCICLHLVTEDGATLEVNEEMAGWEELTAALPTHLPGAIKWSEWFSQVAYPAFATNETIVFERAA